MGVSVVDRIAQLLAQHKAIRDSFVYLEGQINDLESASHLRVLRKKVDSERLASGPWPIQLEEDVSKIEDQLGNHFKIEEDILSECYKIFKDTSLLSSLNRLRSDHAEIITRIGDLRIEAAQIASALSDRQDWIGRAFVLRVHITNTRVLLERHAEEEEVIFKGLMARAH